MYVVDGMYIRVCGKTGITSEFIMGVVKKLKCKCGWWVFKKKHGEGG